MSLHQWGAEQAKLEAPPSIEAALLGHLRRRRWQRRAWFAVPLAAGLAFFAWRPAPPPVPTPAPFYAVGAWQAVEPIERGTIIRSKLPRATLIRFGAPVSAADPAPVDLLLGEDGTLRGFRPVIQGEYQ